MTVRVDSVLLVPSADNDDVAFRKDVLAAINEKRAKHGVSPLKICDKVSYRYVLVPNSHLQSLSHLQ